MNGVMDGVRVPDGVLLARREDAVVHLDAGRRNGLRIRLLRHGHLTQNTFRHKLHRSSRH